MYIVRTVCDVHLPAVSSVECTDRTAECRQERQQMRYMLTKQRLSAAYSPNDQPAFLGNIDSASGEHESRVLVDDHAASREAIWSSM